MDRAACINEDPEIFFPDKTELHTKGNEAITICFSCRVRAECKDWKVRTGSKFGIWAGEISKRTGL